MTRSNILGLGFAVGVVVGSFSWIPETQACTFRCPEPLRAPTGSVPANALAIPLFDPATTVELVGPGGPVVVQPEAATDGTTVLRPTGDLMLGPHTLSYDSKCQGKRIDVAFNVTEAAAAPTTLGNASVRSAGIEGTSWLFVEVSLYFDQAVLPYSGLLDLRPEVDGLPVSDFNFEYESTVRLQTSCPAEQRPEPVRDSCGGVTSVPPGRHTLSFIPSIAGLQAPLPSASLEVSLDCAWLNSVRPVSVASTDASTDTATDKRAGCAIARPRSNLGLRGLLTTLIVVGGLWIMGRRRRVIDHPLPGSHRG